MPDTAPITRLRRIVAAAEAGAALPADDAAWLVTGARQYEAAQLAGLDVRLDGALGLSRPARHGWAATEAIEERDRLLLQVRAEHLPGLTTAGAADAILAALRRPRQPHRRRGGTSSAEAGWDAIAAAVARSGRALPARKRLIQILNRGNMTPLA